MTVMGRGKLSLPRGYINKTVEKPVTKKEKKEMFSISRVFQLAVMLGFVVVVVVLACTM